MQISNVFSGAAFPPSQGGGGPENANQMRTERMHHWRIHLLRTLQIWWLPILLCGLGGLMATVLAPFALNYPTQVFGILCALPFFFLAVRRLELGLFIIAFLGAPFSPVTLTLKSLEIDPPVILVLLLAFVITVLMALQANYRPVLPSFWIIWPLFGLILLALISNLVVQITWTPGVPFKIINSPVLFDEIYGVSLFCYPLLVIFVVNATMTGHERWVQIIVNTYLLLATAAAVIIIIDFRRIGADVYSYRFAEPKIAWMSLRALAQLLGLGAMIAYANCLLTTRWLMRIFYALPGLMCLVGVYFTLENSWWVEVGIALIVMTLVYSRKLFLFVSILALPLIPLLKQELAKLQSVKSADYYRLVIWQDALRVWKKQPVLGVGPGNFWAYDQRFTQLPRYFADFSKTGLGVAHNGYLQTLGELGPLGLFLMLTFIVIMIITASQLYRRSKSAETRDDRLLALVCLGLVTGSTVADFFSGSFFLQPRQIGSSQVLPQLTSTWIIYGFVIYKDQLWRKARRRLRIEG